MTGPTGRGSAIARTAIIVSHGQPSEPDPPEADLAALAARVARHLPGWRIASATLAKPGALDIALGAAGGACLVYPLFMTDGWFVRSALPKRLGDVPARILPPLGVDPALPALVADHLITVLQTRGWRADETCLLVASHGSGRSPRSKQATEAFTVRLAARLPFGDIRTGYVEEPPRIGDMVRDCPSPALCLPFFAAYGGHVKEDITEALAAGAFPGPLLDPIGTFDAIPELIARSLALAADARPD